MIDASLLRRDSVETDLWCGLRDKRLVKLEHRELRSVEDLVAELAVALDAQDLEVDVATCTEPLSAHTGHTSDRS